VTVSTLIVFHTNVKLSLCLIKYHAINTYPVPNQEPRQENMRGSGGRAPRILIRGTSGGDISFTPPPFYSPGKSPSYPLVRRVGGPQNRSGGS